ncbi:MAG TPA: hypothetical protein VFZ59_03935 [Verrucomicrobiae bacterium]|nr:hypothetical protein [Verrucomicrobiae bacterium]
MNTAEWLTRGTVWLALTLYVAAELAVAFKRGVAGGLARGLNTVGVAVYVLHVVCAFHFYHQWSHSVAYADTARQTAEFSGWNWGGGLYVNYLFTLVWLSELIWWWASPTTFARRPRWMGRVVRGFFMFMTFNGAVVFAHSPMRWYGVVLCVLLVVSWWRLWKRASSNQKVQQTENVF